MSKRGGRNRHAAVGAALSFIGLIHAPEVAWAASPAVALGYLMFGLVCLTFWLLPGGPGGKEPIEITDDAVAGH